MVKPQAFDVSMFKSHIFVGESGTPGLYPRLGPIVQAP